MSEHLESSQNLPSEPGVEPDELSDRERKAIALLITGMTHTAVADELGVNRRTLWEWKQDPTFVAALNNEREAIREAMQDRVLGLAEKALTALEQTLERSDSDGARVAAARLVLDRLLPPYTAEEARPQAGPERVRVIRESDIERLGEIHRRELAAERMGARR
jgi:hypothetical protein